MYIGAFLNFCSSCVFFLPCWPINEMPAGSYDKMTNMTGLFLFLLWILCDDTVKGKEVKQYVSKKAF